MRPNAWKAKAIVLLLLALIARPAAPANAQSTPPPTFDGEWQTSFSTVSLKQTGTDVMGTYGDAGQFTIKGTVKAKNLTFEYQEGQAKGDGDWTLDDSRNSFHGKFKIRGGQGGEWNGWRPDPQAPKDKAANLDGIWLTDLGLMELTQTKGKAKGHYALGGTSSINGNVNGRNLDFKYKGFRKGKGWFDVSPDGKTFAGAARTEGFPGFYGWHGRQAPEFVKHVKLVAGKIVDGSTKGLLTYSVRAPEKYKDGDDWKWPAILILHGSNMNAKAYVNTIAITWPDIAKDYLIIGINGEQPSNLGTKADDAAFNYTYVDYVGRSTFKGFPGTDRESPALVAEAMDELRETYPISKYFVGGHSQGGFLTYSLLMNFPEKIAGAFPISSGIIFQCEPGAYSDEKLRAAQRAVPLAIIHSKQDNVVNFSAGEFATTLFGEAHWPAFRFFADPSGAGHRFALLPVDKAIRWLEVQSSDEPKRLLDFAEQRMKAKGYRDAIATVNRTREMKLDDAMKSRLDRLSHDLDAKAAPGAKQFLPKIQQKQTAKSWIDAFLLYRDDFEFAPAAHEVMEAFAALRVEQEEPAKKALGEASAAFQQGNRAGGYAKYQEIVDKYYAASPYRNVKRWLGERK